MASLIISDLIGSLFLGLQPLEPKKLEKIPPPDFAAFSTCLTGAAFCWGALAAEPPPKPAPKLIPPKIPFDFLADFVADFVADFLILMDFN